MCGQPETGNLFGFCADYLEGRIEERDKSDSNELSKKKRFASKKEKEETEKTTRKMLRREGTFSLYATDSGNYWQTHYMCALLAHQSIQVSNIYMYLSVFPSVCLSMLFLFYEIWMLVLQILQHPKKSKTFSFYRQRRWEQYSWPGRSGNKI